MSKLKIYPINHHYVKQFYPVVYRVFVLNEARPGYEKFRQAGLKLKQKKSTQD